MTTAHNKHLLTAQGESFYSNFMAAKDELKTGVSELTQLGWEQHQGIARTMYNRFPEVFRKGGNILAISSLSGRCVLSMSAFCQELVQCNPKLEIREQSSRFTLDGVVPDDSQNPVKHNYPKAKPRYEKNRSTFRSDNSLQDRNDGQVISHKGPHETAYGMRCHLPFFLNLNRIVSGFNSLLSGLFHVFRFIHHSNLFGRKLSLRLISGFILYRLIILISIEW